MIEQNVRIGRIEDRVLRIVGEEVVRVLHQVLIDRRVVPDQDRDRLALSPSRSARLLPGRRDRSRISD